MECSSKIDKIVPALLKAQSAMPAVTKDGSNPHFGSKYASLPGIFSACMPVLNKQDIFCMQAPGLAHKAGTIRLTTTLMHKSGQWISSSIYMPTGKDNAQGVGSALTYARRYSYCAMLGIVSDADDDGNAATDKGNGGPKAGDTASDPIEELF